MPEVRNMGITLYPEQIEIVKQFAKASRRNFSNALRFIIEEWAAAQPPTQPQPKRLKERE